MSLNVRIFIKILIFILTATTFGLILFIGFQYSSRATSVRANIQIDTKKVVDTLPLSWKALAQGGEEYGVRMLQNVTTLVQDLQPKYIRIDHIYDFYNVVSRNSQGNLLLNWSELDNTVCDIYATGAKPFFALGYMPSVMSEDQSPIGRPTNWNEWSYLVQKTIERYSGTSTTLCGNIQGESMVEIYYEVWNEPDLNTFGKWSLYSGNKDYKVLYYYSVLGANQAQNVHRFYIGGPATTALYKNWITVFLDFIIANNLRIDFLSWHHYTKSADDFTQDMQNITQWLADAKYANFRYIQKIITEWGYDSNPNPFSDTNVGAAHTVASLRNFIDSGLTYGFSFEVKDGPVPRWGILGHQAQPKPRFFALKFLNQLQNFRLKVDGEGTYVKAIASGWLNKTVVILVNYDDTQSNIESVPVNFNNLSPGTYSLKVTNLDGSFVSINPINVPGSQLTRSVIMQPNAVVSLELTKLN